MKIIITGATGFIGKALVSELLAQKHTVVLLTRDGKKYKSLPAHGIEIVEWNTDQFGDWCKAVNGADAVIHLAGEPIMAKRWSHSQKEILRKSRINSTRLLVQAIENAAQKPKVMICASAVGFYGATQNQVTESSPAGSGFLAQLCMDWEKEAQKVEALGVRVVNVRIGVVLEKSGGALQKMLPPFRFFLGGPLGSGEQWFPWVHRDDVVGLILFALENARVKGPMNAVAPECINMKQFCSILGGVIGRPSWAPVPAFVIQLMLGEVSEVLLKGQCVIPEKAQALGYRFRHTNTHQALLSIFKK
jgi:uncharacterized protein (TIGR01777 family)